MSIAVWAGLIALTGVDAETGVFRLYLDPAWEKAKMKQGRLCSFADPCRPSPAARRGGALRLLASLLLALVVTDAPSMVVLCLDGPQGCGTVCARCWCKRASAASSVRAPCPCCRPQPGARGPLSDLGPAILQRSAVSIVLPVGRLAPGASLRPPSFTPPVPHPPPRPRPASVNEPF